MTENIGRWFVRAVVHLNHFLWTTDARRGIEAEA